MTNEMVVDVSQDWVLACNVQQRFMQGVQRAAGTMDYSAQCRQVRAIGGDCYDFLPFADGRVAMVVGDASGKGLPAALMIANVQSSVRAATLFTADHLAALLGVVNELAYKSSLADRYATLFYGVFDGTNRTLRYGNAGHNPPVVLQRNGSVHRLEAGGPPIGMFEGSGYQESIIQLQPGDMVIAYTDGVVEATNQDGEEWGVEGLLSAAVSAGKSSGDADDLVRLIFKSMEKFCNEQQTDDATLAVLRVM